MLEETGYFNRDKNILTHLYDLNFLVERHCIINDQTLTIPSRLNFTKHIAIPLKKINKICLLGIPVDFARDPPRSPAIGSYLYRKLCKTQRYLYDLGDINYSNYDNIIQLGVRERKKTILKNILQVRKFL